MLIEVSRGLAHCFRRAGKGRSACPRLRARTALLHLAYRLYDGESDDESSLVAPYIWRARLTVERCNGIRCSLTKNALPVGFIRARSLSHAPMARSSSQLDLDQIKPEASGCSSVTRALPFFVTVNAL